MSEKDKLVLVDDSPKQPPQGTEGVREDILFFRKMHEMRKTIAKTALEIDGYNSHQKYEYSKAKQYKQILNTACMEHGMEFYVNMESVETIFLPNDTSKQHLTRLHGKLIMIDLDTGFNVGFHVYADGCDALDKGIYKADTMLIKSFVQTTFLRHDNDEIDPEVADKPKGFVPTAKRNEIAQTVVTSEDPANEEMYDKIYDAVMALRAIDPQFMQDGELEKFNDSTLTQTEAVGLLLDIEERAEDMGVEL